MIDSLAGVTIVTPDLDAAILAYQDWLGYRADGVTTVGAVLAERWKTAAAAPARMAMLRPESGESRFIRLIEGVPGPGYAPMASYGWIAAEIIVQDVERLAERLGASGSPFRIIGAPAILDFDFTDKIKAMQVVGPGGEVLYLTEVGEAIPGFDLPTAESFVSQLFIMVLGAPSIDRGTETYAALGRLAGPGIKARIEVLAAAHDIPINHRFDLLTITLADRSLIEVDAMPDSATARALSSVGLPSGIAMVSFHVSGPAAKGSSQVGGAGEWLEFMPD